MFKRFLAISLAGLIVSGCVSTVLDVDKKALQPIPASLAGKMRAKNMTEADPIVVRIFKEESELEIWKRDRSGRYALLKTYPMCRWSGQLGPKKRNGDRQAPEGFYHVSAGMLNPNSQYYLSFNLGYPNRLEAALGYSGEALMVHGACSSSGCYAMTDEGVAEIYAVAREALKGGQTVFQVQAYPFRMTPKNMARHRNDPNYPFWQNLKRGYDLFATTRQQPAVGYCGRDYAFAPAGTTGLPTDPLGACPPALVDPLVVSSLSGGQPSGIIPSFAGSPASGVQRSGTTSSGTTSSGPTSSSSNSSGASAGVHAYSDGGMHPSFRKLLRSKGAEKLAKMTSFSAVPISRPEAALADPHR